MSTGFGLELIYNQIKRLFTGIKFLFIRTRHVLAPRQQVELCDKLQARDFIVILMVILVSIISLKRCFHKHKRIGEIRFFNSQERVPDIFIVAPCILKSILFTHQQMHYLLNLKRFKIYTRIHINIAPTCFGLRPSSGRLY
jgi:hypothetical protein